MSIGDITEGLNYAHNLGKKGYMALNIYPHNEDIKPLREYLNEIKDIPIDAFIVSDPGVVYLLKEIIHTMIYP
jgi:putative protease